MHDTIKTCMKDFAYGIRTSIDHSVWLLKHEMGKLQRILPFQKPDNIVQPSGRNVVANNIHLRVVGVGFGRTGTYSLKRALDLLGYQTLHTQHMYETPEILDMWVDRVFQPAIDAGSLELGDPDFEVITAHGYQAIVDLPTALYYKELNEKYPDCKFILTTREDSDEWFRSFDAMITSVNQVTTLGGSFFRHVNQLALYMRWLNAIVTKNKDVLKIPIGMAIPYPNKQQSIEAYEDHNRSVRDFIPGDKLLEYSVKEGWEPLCTFLDIPDCPTVQFPKTNSATSIKGQVSFVYAIYMCLFAAVMIMLYRSTSKCWKILSGRKYPRRRILAKKIF